MLNNEENFFQNVFEHGLEGFVTANAKYDWNLLQDRGNGFFVNVLSL